MNSTLRVVSVVGARPQLVKASVVSRALRDTPGVHELIVHTGQHYDKEMSDVFFAELEIPRPDRNLGIGSGPHGAQTGRMIEALEAYFLEVKPDRVLVHGDTNSTLAGAIAASKLAIPVDHVEAGLRSFDRKMPEEINRVLADHVADLCFAPTEGAVENLAREGIAGDAKVKLTGDVMLDAALRFAARASERRALLERLGVEPRAYVLATIHRAENTDDPARLEAIFRGLERAASETAIVVPLHPRTRGALERAGITPKKLKLTEPVGYLDMILLEMNARAIATDSGGVQKEAFFFEVPCVTLRNETEWQELVRAKWNRVRPPISPEAVEHAVRETLDAGPGERVAPYGDGHAASKIAASIASKARSREI